MIIPIITLFINIIAKRDEVPQLTIVINLLI